MSESVLSTFLSIDDDDGSRDVVFLNSLKDRFRKRASRLRTLTSWTRFLRNFKFMYITYVQRCRSVFNIGGYNSAFLPFFRDFEILGGYSGFVDFSSFNDFENLGGIFRF